MLFSTREIRVAYHIALVYVNSIFSTHDMIDGHHSMSNRIVCDNTEPNILV